ncbi:hypothetical protein Ancab_021984 [Ancistrocladus abbreviatus]
MSATEKKDAQARCKCGPVESEKQKSSSQAMSQLLREGPSISIVPRTPDFRKRSSEKESNKPEARKNGLESSCEKVMSRSEEATLPAIPLSSVWKTGSASENDIRKIKGLEEIKKGIVSKTGQSNDDGSGL